MAQHHRFVGGQVLQGEVDDEWAAQVPHTDDEGAGSGATPQVHQGDYQGPRGQCGRRGIPCDLDAHAWQVDPAQP